MIDIADIYRRCIASGFNHEGALDFIVEEIEKETRAALAALREGLAEPPKDLVTTSH